MISSAYDIREFVDSIRQKPYCEVIYLAEREALNAWRASLKSGRQARAHRYEMILKEFVRYLRSDLEIPKGFPPDLCSLHEQLRLKKPAGLK